MSTRKIFDSVSQNKIYFCIVVAFSFVVGLAMNLVGSGLSNMENSMVPDVRFGFTRDDLHSLYESWGVVGRSIYLRINFLDFIFIICYTLLLGSLSVITARMSRSSLDFAPIAIVTAICDLIETLILRKAVYVFPSLISSNIAFIGSLAQQMKWVCLCINILLIVLFGFRSIIKNKSKLN